MEFSDLFINENLVNLIYNNLVINDKVNFSSINKYSYNNYKGINKLRVYEYVNKDYKLFRKALERFKYSQEELLNISDIAIKNIPIVKEKKTGTFQTNGIENLFNNYYDLRYLFELILNGLNTKSLEFDNIMVGTFNLNNDSRLKLMYIIKIIRKNISFSRTETIWKINSEPSLRTLHSSFNPCIPWDTISY